MGPPPVEQGAEEATPSERATAAATAASRTLGAPTATCAAAAAAAGTAVAGAATGTWPRSPTAPDRRWVSATRPRPRRLWPRRRDMARSPPTLLPCAGPSPMEAEVAEVVVAAARMGGVAARLGVAPEAPAVPALAAPLAPAAARWATGAATAPRRALGPLRAADLASRTASRRLGRAGVLATSLATAARWHTSARSKQHEMG